MFAFADAVSEAACAAARAALICPTWAAAACWACWAALRSPSLGLTGSAEAVPGATPSPVTATAAMATTRVAQRPPARRRVLLPCLVTCVSTVPTPPLPAPRCMTSPVPTSPGTPGGARSPRGHRPDRGAGLRPWGCISSFRGSRAGQVRPSSVHLALRRRPEGLTQFELLDLPRGGAGDRLAELHPLGRLVPGDPLPRVRDELRLGHRLPLGEDDERGDHLAPLVVGDA